MGLKGGDKMADALGEMDMSGTVKVGFLENATYPDGTPVATVAYLNEVGHKGRFPAPPRPFFRTTVEKEKPTWSKKISKLAEMTHYDGPRVLAMMGEDIKGALQQSIAELQSPELSETTKMLRSMFGNNPQDIRARDVLAAQGKVAAGESGASGTGAKPLIWTGHMKDSVDYEVEK
jgi:hypothetical protein